MDYKFVLDSDIKDRLLKAQEERINTIEKENTLKANQITIDKKKESGPKIKSLYTNDQKKKHRAKISSVLTNIRSTKNTRKSNSYIYSIGDLGKSRSRKKYIRINSPTTNELAIATKQLASMIRTGLPLLEALNIIAESNQNQTLQLVFKDIAVGITRGATLVECMQKFPQVFNDMYIALVSAGESAGLLPNVLLRQAKLLENLSKIKAEIKSAMSYPIAIFILTIVVIIIMLTFVIPIFIDIYATSGAELPFLTQLLVNSSNSIRDTGFLIRLIPILTVVYFVLRRVLRSEYFLFMLDRFLLAMPITRQLVTKTSLANFSRTLSSLNAAGVPILESLLIAKKTISNRLFIRVVDKMYRGIQSGQQIYKTLEEERIIPIMFTSMFRIGEETGELTEMVNKLADFYEDDVSTTVKTLTSILEPLMIVFVASIIAIILVAMYLPMFNMMSTTG